MESYLHKFFVDFGTFFGEFSTENNGETNLFTTEKVCNASNWSARLKAVMVALPPVLEKDALLKVKEF